MSDALLPLKRYFEFTGRSRRREYWLWSFFYFFSASTLGFIVLISEALMDFSETINNSANANSIFPTLPSDWLAIVLFLATVIPNLAVTARRLQDTNRSVKWFLILAIPLIGPIVFTVLMCLKGTQGANRFGPDPKS